MAQPGVNQHEVRVAVRKPAVDQFRPFSRGGASVLCKANLEKVAFGHFFDSLCFPLIIGITL